MNLAKKLLMTTGTSSGTVPTPSGEYVDDVFSAYTYTGNGTTQTISNGIDLAGKGGMVWVKSRNIVDAHWIFDTVRGGNNGLSTNSTSNGGGTGGSSFTSSGFVAGGVSGVNGFGSNQCSWTFRRAPKFFDVVTYTGDGTSNRQIAHSLGVQAGFVTVKSTSTTGDWNSYHRSATGDLKLNLSNTQTASRTIITAADANTFAVSGVANTNGVSYVAYLWANDPSADGIIQCGSFTGNTTVNIGWEPQWIMIKRTDAAGDWIVIDSMRGCSVGGVDAVLNPNLSNAESVSNDYIDFTATGFITKNLTGTCIYTVVRRHNKPPTTGTQVYNAIARTGTGAAATVTGVGFAPDMLIVSSRNSSGNHNAILNRLVGASSWIESNRTDMLQEQFNDAANTFTQDGVYWNNASGATNNNTISYINHFFRCATGFMDVVRDTGTEVAHAIAHNLTKVPELIIRKSRSAATQWEVWHSALAATEKLVLNSNAARATDATAWNSTLPTATQFTVGTGANVNANAATFVTYLFSTFPGISKIGSYSGNGGTQTIPCGFTTGSRFILIKRIDNTGDWFVWDTTRGITPTTDPHLSLNTTAAEVTTDDSIDQDASGFVVNQNAATNINALGGNYLFLAIA